MKNVINQKKLVAMVVGVVIILTVVLLTSYNKTPKEAGIEEVISTTQKLSLKEQKDEDARVKQMLSWER